MYSTRNKASRDYILERIREEDIFHLYLGIYPEEGKRYCNPLRTDESPDCKFYRDERGRLKFHDIPMKWNWDCFNVVQYKYSLNFSESLLRVATDFGIISGTHEALAVDKIIIESAPLKDIKIEIAYRDWNNIDKKFWTSQLIYGEKLQKYNVFPVLKAWLDGSLRYIYKDTDPCYAYRFGPYQYKLYFPFRKDVRFIQNVRGILQGYDQLPEEGDILVITKSLKDVIFLDGFDIPAVAPLGESILITRDQFIDLYNRFDNIFSLMDFGKSNGGVDRTGTRTAFEMRRTYGIEPLFLTNGRYGTYDYGAKDITDFGKKYGLQDTLDLIQQTKEIIL